jgi:predicted Fe-Mo cluster-binding NifX family protein
MLHDFMGNQQPTMKTAFAYLDARIAPVFDTAQWIRVVEIESGQIIGEAKEQLAQDLPMQKTLRLAELGINTLVCGAITRTLKAMITAYGIQVIPFVAGDLRTVIQAWRTGDLRGSAFVMPGCCKHARFGKSYFIEKSKEGKIMNGKGQGGMGGGGGGGRGQGGMGGGRGQGGMGGGRGRSGGPGRGRMNGPMAGGAIGQCVCPKCGEHLAHERGVPCVQRQCPKCGTLMTRE